MIIRDNLDEIERIDRAVALGMFDGIHKGHRAVIENVLNSDCESCVFTFAKSGGKSGFIYTDIRKADLLADFGIDLLVTVDFDSVREFSPREFFKRILIEKLGAVKIVVGDDFRFGKEAAGDIETLEQLCGEYNIELLIVRQVNNGRKKVSTTDLKNLLADGDIKELNKLLTEPYQVSGVVIEGRKLGRTIGFPTANIEFAPGQSLPKYGVYKTRVNLLNKSYNGITSVGIKPTVGGEYPLCENHILNFNSDIYGETITVEFIDFIRAEQKMNSVLELSEQIAKDIKKAFAKKTKI